MLKCLIKDRHGPIGAAYKRWNTAVLMFGTLVIPGVIIAAITSVIVAFLSRAARRRESLQMDRQVACGLDISYWKRKNSLLMLLRVKIKINQG